MLKSSRILAAAGAVAGLGLAAAPLNVFAVDASDQHTDQLVVTVLPSCTFGFAGRADAPFPSGIEHEIASEQADGQAYGASAAANVYEHGASEWTTTETTAGTAGAADNNADDINGNPHTANVLQSTGYGLAGEGKATSDNGLGNSSWHTVHRSMLAGTSTDTFAKTKMTIICNNAGGYSVTATATALSNGTQAEDIAVNITYGTSTDNYATSAYNLKTINVSTGVTGATGPQAPTTEGIIAKKSSVTADNGDSVEVIYGMGIKSAQKSATYSGTVTYKLYKGVNGAGETADLTAAQQQGD